MFFICIYLVLQRKILGILTYHHIFRCLRFTYPISGLGHHHPKQITPKEGLYWEPFPISIVQPHDKPKSLLSKTTTSASSRLQKNVGISDGWDVI